MNPLLKTIIIIMISSGVFTILLNQLYKTNPKILSFIHKVPKGWKGKYFIKWTVLMFLIIIVSALLVAGLNDTIGTIIIGFCISITDLTFAKPKRIN